mmetsp:Transcript_11008/g.7668  ORF Transcript_11008/g.7668 Transcript_11008/m.7668 type:complete len:219 (+) Transcript_11008:898-1554(+)
MATSTPHNNRIKTIKSHNSEEVTRVDSVRINLNLLDLSLNKFIIHTSLQESNILFLHVLRNRGTEESFARIGSQTTNECLKGDHQGFQTFLESFTEHKGLDSTESNILLLINSGDVKLHVVSTVSKEQFEVVQFGVREVESLGTPEVLGVLQFNVELEFGFTQVSEVQGNEFVAHTLPGGVGIGGSRVRSKHWEEFEGFVGVVGAILAVPDRLGNVIV